MDDLLGPLQSKYVEAGATISTDGRYRYKLWREWRGVAPDKNWRWLGAKDGSGQELGWPLSCVFVMLNPSTADGSKDDPTIRRCVGFAKRLGYDRLVVVNLFAYRATNPKELLALNHDDDPVGVENSTYVKRATFEDCGVVVCAWGAHGSHLGQAETVMGWLPSDKTYCLGKTKAGHPRHPLYLPDDQPLERYQ